MAWRRAVGIAAGGVLGAVARWALLSALPTPARLPWPVLLVNVVGSAILGMLLAEEWEHPRARMWLHDVAGIGFCGGLTTFSTFSVGMVDLLRDDVAIAVAYAVTSVVASVAGVVGGAALLHHVRAAALPLEEQP